MTTRRIPPTDTRASGYLESEVNAWIHARIKGEPWEPGPIPADPRILRLREAQERTGLSNFTLWTMEQVGKFPRRIRLTEPADRATADVPSDPHAAPRKVRFTRGTAA